MTVCKKDTYTITTQIYKTETDVFPSISPTFNAIKSCEYLSRDMRFPTMWYMRPAKAQTSLRICAD